MIAIIKGECKFAVEKKSQKLSLLTCSFGGKKVMMEYFFNGDLKESKKRIKKAAAAFLKGEFKVKSDEVIVSEGICLTNIIEKMFEKKKGLQIALAKLKHLLDKQAAHNIAMR